VPNAFSPARTIDPVRAGLRSIPAAQRRVAAVVVTALAADQAFDPNRTHVPLCPLHALTGIWCPFCGGLRSAYELTRLHLSAALHDNLVVVAAAPVVLALWIDGILRERSGLGRRRIPRPAVLAVVVALIAFTVVRNLPVGTNLRGG
jgi:hypothetical protein